MLWLWLAIELSVEAFASWTLAVHLCMAFALPAYAAWPLAALGFAGCLGLGRGRLARARDVDRSRTLAREHDAGPGEGLFAVSSLAIGALFAGLSLILLTPSADDFNFFHRALWQLDHLAEPFARGDTAFNVDGLAAISPLHVLTTWELGVAMDAWGLGLEPLGVYHNGAVVAANLLFAAMVAVWLRELRFGPKAALAGCFGAFAFLLADDPQVRSFAIAYRMFWVGKMLQWLLLFPIALLFALRYLRDPTPRTLWHPLLCGLCAVGLSGTGVFLLPGVFAAASLAGLVMHGVDPKHILRCGLLNLGSLYCFGVAGLVLTGVLPQPEDTRAWTEKFPADWIQNLMLVFGSPTGIARYATLGLVLPALALQGGGRRFVLGFVVALIAIFLNPLAAPLWIEAVQPGSFWRILLLVPLPVFAGVALAAFVDGIPSRAQAATLVAIVVALLVAGRFAIVGPGRSMPHLFAIKAPLELRFAPAELRFARQVAQELEYRSLLAPPGIAATAALIVPSLRLEAARFQDTRHVFVNAGREAEGAQRLRAWSWAGRCEPFPEGASAARESLSNGVDAVILRECADESLVALERRGVFARAPGSWAEAARGDGFVLFLRH